MIRVVRARAEGDHRRTWTVRSSISWARPAMEDKFETDMAGGYFSGSLMLGLLIVLTVFVVFWGFWSPTEVVIPTWFGLLALLALLMLPVLWALQRPWVVTAHTEEPIETGGEYWEGVVRGVVSAREEAYRVADELRRWGVPNSGAGPLTRLTPADSRSEP